LSTLSKTKIGNYEEWGGENKSKNFSLSTLSKTKIGNYENDNTYQHNARNINNGFLQYFEHFDRRLCASRMLRRIVEPHKGHFLPVYKLL